MYESYDRGKTWRFFTNLPVTQFYKSAVDNDYPFYNVYGGTQDNFTLGGPSQTTETTGISDRNWFVTVLGDGFEPDVDPTNPDIVYSQSQYGNLNRFDRKTGVTTNIVPQPPNSNYSYNWNWDSPFFVSVHDPKRLYFAADRVLRSDDRGQSWKEISGDLTRALDRNKLEVMGKVWPIDAVAKNESTTLYGNIVALAESPLDEHILFAGTDDGLIHISQDGGQTWKKFDKFPDVPEMTYVNEIVASHHNKNVIYVAFNNHKNGDFKPYLLMSSDLGKTWKSISSNLPERGSVYSIAEDKEVQGLLFVGTEFSAFFTMDNGAYWQKFKGIPTVAVRDINIQERENDLVLATFGRGIYILDNYSALREFTKEVYQKEAHLFSVQDAFQYEPYSPIAASNTISWLGPKGFQGEDYYLGENPEFGAAFTYYLKDEIQTLKSAREKKEKQDRKDGKTVYYPSLEQLEAEEAEEKPFLIFSIYDATGTLVDEVRTSPKKGINRVYWDLTYPNLSAIPSSNTDQSKDLRSGIMVLPGEYSVQLSKSVNGEIFIISEKQTFTVKSLYEHTLPPANPEQVLMFHKQLMELSKSANSVRSAWRDVNDRLKQYKAATRVVSSKSLTDMVNGLEDKLESIQKVMFGDENKSLLEIDQAPSLNSRINTAIGTGMTYGSEPTETSKMVRDIAVQQLQPVIEDMKKILSEQLPAIDAELTRLNAPYTPGRIIDLKK